MMSPFLDRVVNLAWNRHRVRQSLVQSVVLVALATLCVPWAGAETIPGLPPSLKTVAVPMPAGLLDGPRPIVIDREKAIVLGKALFWDMNVGSDGVACATCHFHAGADARTKNQFGPSKAHVPAQPTDPNAFDPIDARGARLANYQLTAADFPLFKFGDPSTPFMDAVTLQSPKSYNVVASAGTFSGQFLGLNPDGSERCTPLTGANLDQTFNVGGIHTRRVEPRNTPTILNAALFDRNFWDGRASFTFNGVSGSGARDPNAYLWVVDPDSYLWKTRLALDDSSIASVAVQPVTNEFEMSCRGRSFKDVARKLLRRRPLEQQQVHPADSVLGPYRDASGKGLALRYEDLVKAAFAPRFWSAGNLPVFGRPTYGMPWFSQAESNFSMFFGLSIQLYLSTLISDDTAYDRADLVATPPVRAGQTITAAAVISDRNGSLSSLQLQGLRLFVKGLCNRCHSGPMMSSATTRTQIDRQTGLTTTRAMIDRQNRFFDLHINTLDVGYFNNGSVPSEHDPGLGGGDERGQPLAFTEQFLQGLAGQKAKVYEPLPPFAVCNFQFPYVRDFSPAELIPDPAGTAGCSDPAAARLPRPEVVAAALADPNDSRFIHGGHLFKAPQLYNVELTGPYMHNGGMATLEQALDNYSRGGNFGSLNPDLAGRNRDLSAGIVGLFFKPAERAALVEFLKALTDERVRYERAPFDHPQLWVANGHPGDHLAVRVAAGQPGLAADELIEIPAVGRDGRTVPLPRFDELLPAF